MEAEYNHLNHATWECRVPRRVHAEVPQEGAVREDQATSGPSISRSGTTEGVPDRGRPFDARSRSYADIDTSEIFGGTDHRVHEREEFDMDRAECRTQDAQFPGSQILGSRIFCHDCWPRWGNDPGLHQKPGDGRRADGPDGAEDVSRPRIQSIVVTSLKTAFGGSPSNLQLCWRLLARNSKGVNSQAEPSHGPQTVSSRARLRRRPIVAQFSVLPCDLMLQFSHARSCLGSSKYQIEIASPLSSPNVIPKPLI